MESNNQIKRLEKFFSEDDFRLNMDMSYEYLHGDLSMSLLLYRVDIVGTDNDAVYAESTSNEIKFLDPVEFYALVKVDSPKNSAYSDGMIRYLEPGNLTLNVYINHLEELGLDIKYGDYIGYREQENYTRLYVVSNDGKVVSDNKHNFFGYKPYYRTIICVPVQEKEFGGI